MKYRTGPWTSREVHDAQHMRQQLRMTYQQIGDALNRPWRGVRAKLTYVPTPAVPNIHDHAGRPITVPPVPPTAIEERDRRLALEPRDLTAAFFGDPLPGYSALERR